MNSISTNHALVVAAIIFITGVIGVLVRRNLVFILMSLEIMLAGASIAFVAAGSKWNQADGQVIYIFILVVAAAEVAIGLSLLLRIYNDWKDVDTDLVDELKEEANQ